MYGKYKGVGYMVYAFMQHRCGSSARGYVRKHTVGRGRQSGLTQHVHCTPFEDDLLPIVSREPYPPLASQNSVKCPERVEVCGVFKQSDTALELPCLYQMWCISIIPSVFLVLGGQLFGTHRNNTNTKHYSR